MNNHYLILIISLTVCAAAVFWWTAFLYRKWLVRKYFSDVVQYPNALSKFTEVNGIRLHYIVDGNGPDLLLLHGIGANIYCWRLVVPLLSKFFRVWAVDLKGFGQSAKPRMSDYGLKAQAELLLDFLRQQKIGKCIVVGNSMGGAIASEMAIRDSALVDNLVLINSAHDPRIVRRIMWFDLRPIRKYLIHPMAPFVTRTTVRQFIKTLYGTKRVISNEVVDAYLAPYMTEIDSHHAFASAFDALLDKDLVSRLKTISTKVLILWGKRDRLCPLKFGQELQQRLPNSILQVHENAGHHMQEEEPERIAQHIKTFYLE